MKITKAKNDDLKNVLKLLKEVELTVEGVSDHFPNFFVMKNGEQIIGCAGIEIYEDVGLLRSIAVHSSFQNEGLGHQLVGTIHDFSIEKGLKEIYLLTETAENFFMKLNYTVIPREKADPRVKQSIEFTSACPASAVCMMKRIN
ncbi:MAG: arsenic resistance N-acetyltransferase ArsN2 [Candidatus Hodarchaeales archaeon]|jgi:amino-acid N-acetyltransferase